MNFECLFDYLTLFFLSSYCVGIQTFHFEKFQVVLELFLVVSILKARLLLTRSNFFKNFQIFCEEKFTPLFVVNQQISNWGVSFGPFQFVKFVVELIRNGIKFQGQLKLSYRLWKLDDENDVLCMSVQPVFELNDFMALLFNVIN